MDDAFLIAGHKQYATTIESADEDPGFPAANLLTPSLSKAWVGPAGSSASVRIGLGGSRDDVGAIVLHSLTVGSNATWTVRLADQLTAFDGGAGTVTDALVDAPCYGDIYPTLMDDTPPWGRLAAHFPADPVAAAFAEITVTDPDLPGGFAPSAGHLVIGPRYQLSVRRSSPGTEDQVVGQNGMEKTLRGAEYSWRCDDANRAALLSLFYSLGSTGRVYICPRPSSPSTWRRDFLLARVESYRDQIVDRTYPPRFDVSANFREVDD